MGRGEITQLLFQLRTGDRSVESRLIQLLYPELHKIAGRLMSRERPGHTLQATGLLHQAYIRIAEDEIDWKSRAHFMAVSAQVMRNILVDYARSRSAQRRGGSDHVNVPLDSIPSFVSGDPDRVLAINQALDRLEKSDSRCARILEGYYFGGLTVEELAVSLDISPRTVKRDLSFAKSWIIGQLGLAA